MVFLKLNQSKKVSLEVFYKLTTKGRKCEDDSCSLPIHKPITRYQTTTYNNLVSNPGIFNHHLKQVENKFGSLVVGLKGTIKSHEG